jgi:hypothetical protein
MLLVEIGDHDVGALAGEGNCDRPADALSPPVMVAQPL